jgi:hypothetical protein
MSVPALNEQQALELAADEYRGFGPERFEIADRREYDADAYPDPADSDRPVNEHDLWMLTAAMRKGSRAGLTSKHSRKNPTDRTIQLLLNKWDNAADVPLHSRQQLQQADGVGPNKAAQVVGAAVSNNLIQRADSTQSQTEAQEDT